MRKTYRNNTSGYPGVTYDKARGLWRVRFTVRGKRRSYPHLFKDRDAAIEIARAIHARLDEMRAK
jgi:hypothetical protein